MMSLIIVVSRDDHSSACYECIISERANSLIMLNRNFNAIYLFLGFVATSVVRRSLRSELAHARNY